MTDQELKDRLAITDVLTRYATGVDREDWDLWRTAFTEDAVLDYTSVGGPVGSREEVGAWLEASLATVPMKMHHITNVAIDLDGDEAEVTAMFYNPMQLPGMDTLSACGGYYHHEMVRTPDGWRSRHLVEENVWFQGRPDGLGEA